MERIKVVGSIGEEVTEVAISVELVVAEEVDPISLEIAAEVAVTKALLVDSNSVELDNKEADVSVVVTAKVTAGLVIAVVRLVSKLALVDSKTVETISVLASEEISVVVGCEVELAKVLVTIVDLTDRLLASIEVKTLVTSEVLVANCVDSLKANEVMVNSEVAAAVVDNTSEVK